MKLRADQALSPFFLDGWNIAGDKEYEVEYVDAQQFLKAERLDLVSKLLYIEYREKKKNNCFIKKLYSEHIKAFSLGTYTEPGTESKNSIEKYFTSFDQLIDSVKTEGLTAGKSVVPVGGNGSILDGSHRTAIAIYFRLKLPIISIPDISKNYNYLYFKERGMEEKYLDYAVSAYIELSKQCYVACLWPRGKDNSKRNEAEKLINRKASIVYEKQIKFNYNGLNQLMVHIYGKQPWAGTIENSFSGIPVKAKACYGKNTFTKVYVLEGCSLEEIVRLKADIREIFQVENHSIHITDTKQEAMEAAQILFNEHSIKLMNYGDVIKPHNLVRRLLDNSEEYNDYVISVNATKLLFGLKKSVMMGKGSNELWGEDDSFINPIEYGYVYGFHFPSLQKCDTSLPEKWIYNINKLKYGGLSDFVTNLQIKRRVRHLGGVVLRKLRIIR